jgi:hypothetical protein
VSAQRKLLVVACSLAVVAAGVLSRLISPLVGLGFLSGVALGAASFAAVAARVLSGTAPSRWARLGGGLLRWAYYLLLVGGLYLLLVVWRVPVVWLLGGYTVALIVFAVYMARDGRRRVPREGACPHARNATPPRG